MIYNVRLVIIQVQGNIYSAQKGSISRIKIKGNSNLGFYSFYA